MHWAHHYYWGIHMFWWIFWLVIVTGLLYSAWPTTATRRDSAIEELRRRRRTRAQTPREASRMVR